MIAARALGEQPLFDFTEGFPRSTMGSPEFHAHLSSLAGIFMIRYRSLNPLLFFHRSNLIVKDRDLHFYFEHLFFEHFCVLLIGQHFEWSPAFLTHSLPKARFLRLTSLWSLGPGIVHVLASGPKDGPHDGTRNDVPSASKESTHGTA